METLKDKIECLTRDAIEGLDLDNESTYEFEFTHDDHLYFVEGHCYTQEYRHYTYLTGIEFTVYKENKEIEEDEVFELPKEDVESIEYEVVSWFK